MQAFTLIVMIVVLTVLAPVSILHAESVAIVNGKHITQEKFKKYLEKRTSSGDVSEDSLLLNELISRELLLQEAQRLNLQKDAEILNKIEEFKENILIQYLFAHSINGQPISDEAVKKEYDKYIAGVHPKEFNALHILVHDQVTAKNLISKLNNGADFEELAKKESIGPSGENGGHLGWFAATQMVPAFSVATAALTKGAHSQEPVQTKFGFHVIKLQDSRDLEVPKFNDVKEKIREKLEAKVLQEYLWQLRKKASIETVD